MNKGSKEASDRINQPTASEIGELPRWLLWAGGGLALAICIAILLLWGIHGPSFLFDLIAAYCA
jgi:hypothetical protein